MNFVKMCTKFWATLVVAMFAAPAWPQTYPAKPIRNVVPWPAGGPLDTIARALSNELSRRWGQPIVVENRAGAASVIGAELVAKAAPDGYTWMVTPINPTVVGNRYLYKSLPFDPDRGFAPVSLLAQSSQLVVVHASVPANTFAELLALLKQQPGKLNYGSFGQGSQPHMMFELMKKRESIDLTHVAYKGIPPLMSAIAAGEVQITSAGIGSAAGLIKAGKLKALLVAGPERVAELPQLPTGTEAGHAYMQASARFGLFVTGGTPAEIIRRVRDESAAVLAAPEFNDKYLTALGYQRVASTPEAMAAAIREEVTLVGEMARAAEIKPE
jgi:tripartite-type tricarboxylate transporter receptor subunit TctC